MIRKLITRYFAGTASLGTQIYFLGRLLRTHFKWFQILCQFNCQNVKKKIKCASWALSTLRMSLVGFFKCIFCFLVCKRCVLQNKSTGGAWPDRSVSTSVSCVHTEGLRWGQPPEHFLPSRQNSPLPGWGGHWSVASGLFRWNRSGPHSSTAPHPQP